MADGYLEKHLADYEARKAAWLRSGRRFQASRRRQSPQIDRPEDEAL